MSDPNPTHPRLTDDPKLALATVLLIERLGPAILDALRQSRHQGDEAEGTTWFNGALYGACAAFLYLNQPKGGPQIGPHQVGTLFDTASEVIGDCCERYGHVDLDRYANDLLATLPADVRGEAAHV